MMARARNIKPGFFSNEVLAECGPWARLCFAGLWTLADREGRLEDRPRRIKGDLFRFDSVEVEPLLCELEEHGFLVRYQNEAGRFIQILAFNKHQTPHYSEKASVIKPPPIQDVTVDDDTEFQEDSEKTRSPTVHEFQESTRSPPGLVQNDSEATSGVDPPSRPTRNPLIPDSLNPDSGFLIPEEDCGSPLRADPPTPPPDFDGNNAEILNGRAVVAIAAGWELPELWGLDAEALGWKPGAVLREAERFRQYWTVGKGTGTRRSVKGWRQSWSNWLAKAEGGQR